MAEFVNVNKKNLIFYGLFVVKMLTGYIWVGENQRITVKFKRMYLDLYELVNMNDVKFLFESYKRDNMFPASRWLHALFKKTTSNCVHILVLDASNYGYEIKPINQEIPSVPMNLKN